MVSENIERPKRIPLIHNLEMAYEAAHDITTGKMKCYITNEIKPPVGVDDLIKFHAKSVDGKMECYGEAVITYIQCPIPSDFTESPVAGGYNSAYSLSLIGFNIQPTG